MKTIPQVSVVITCYNYGEYVAEAIESVLRQTYDNIELIIINDGSTDNSLEVINQYRKRARIISRPNKGIVYTRNEALDTVQGEYICFLDADDYFDRDYIKNMITIAETTRADVVYPNWHVFGDQEYRTDFAEFDVQKLIKQELHCTSESIIRMASLKGHRFESAKIAEDWDFFLGLALAGKKFVLAKNEYINYRVRLGTRATTKTLWENMYDFYDILQKWHKKYPTIVRPLDLPIGCGMQRDNHIRELETTLKQKKTTLKEKETTIVRLESEKANLEKELTTTKNSIRYKLGYRLVYPFSKTKQLIKKYTTK